MAIIKCKECGEEVSNRADKCPKCGAPPNIFNAPPTKIKWTLGKKALGIFFCLLVVFYLGIVVPSEHEEEKAKIAKKAELAVKTETPKSAKSLNAAAKQWYEGGNLHKASALDWQEAKYDNKLATCADFVTTMWLNKKLKPAILSQMNSMDDLRPLAEELVAGIDEAFKKEPDPTKNKQLFTNQRVASASTLIQVRLGWTK